MSTLQYFLVLVLIFKFSAVRANPGLCHQVVRFKADQERQKTALSLYSHLQKLNIESTDNKRAIFNMENHGSGQVPFWDIHLNRLDSQRIEAILVGSHKSPFSSRESTFRVFAHYLDKKMIQKLHSEFGPPNGFIQASMQSSVRTLLLFPEDSAPYILKFDGSDWYFSMKTLTEEDVKNSVHNSGLTSSGHLLKEPSGLVLKWKNSSDHRKDHIVVYREAPYLDTNEQYLLILHSLLSPELQTKASSQSPFKDKAEQLIWASHVLPRFLVDTVVDVVFDFGWIVPHSQNLSSSFGRDRGTRRLRGHDLDDIIIDPVMQIAQSDSRIQNTFWQVSTLRDLPSDHDPNQNLLRPRSVVSGAFAQIERSILALNQALPKGGELREDPVAHFRQVAKLQALKRFTERITQLQRKSENQQLSTGFEKSIAELQQNARDEKVLIHEFLELGRELFIKLDILAQFKADPLISLNLSYKFGQQRWFGMSSLLVELIGSINYLQIWDWHKVIHGTYRGYKCAIMIQDGRVRDYIIDLNSK